MRSERREPTVSIQRVDPARTGVTAGRVVGILTAALAVASLLWLPDTVYGETTRLLESVGVGFTGPALFWGTVATAAVSRYAFCYVVGSLIGVVYDWLERPSLLVLVGIVTVVGAADGLAALLDTGRPLVGAAYVLAWLCYVPVFAWLFDDSEDGQSGP